MVTIADRVELIATALESRERGGIFTEETRMANTRFIVFDVETPNRYNNRMSAIGISVVEKGKIVYNYFSYVNPETFFDNFNTMLTGIDERTVASAPSFPELWKTIEPLFSSGILVAHNALFDLSVLKKCLTDYGITWKASAEYCCTVQIGRRLLPGMQYKLNVLCDHYGIPLNHHQADSDSRAAAEILLRYMGTGARIEDYVKQYRMGAFPNTRRRTGSAPGKEQNIASALNTRQSIESVPSARRRVQANEYSSTDRFRAVRTENFDLQTYLHESNDINILITASYDKATDIGRYTGLLCYKRHRKLISNIVENAISPNHTMIIGLFDGVQRVRLTNVNICIISGIYMGLKSALSGNGLYAGELQQLMALIEKQGNTVSSIAITNGSAEIKRIIQDSPRGG